jgi:hypothetical protein
MFLTIDVQMQLLEEQQRILDLAGEHKNIQILALAGSGKTTVSLFLAGHLYNLFQKKTLILTYNKKLQVDTKERVNEMDMNEYCAVNTIHAATGKYANPRIVALENSQLETIVNQNKPMQPVDFEVFIIDEAQDLLPLYLKCIHMLLQSAIELHGKVQIIILGDPLQRINAFRGAVSDFLLDPSTYFFGYPFQLCRLTVNFRCSLQIVLYVNNLMNEIFLRLRRHRSYRGWWEENGHIMLNWWGNGLQPCPKALEEGHLYAYPKEVMVYQNKRKFKEIDEKEFSKEEDISMDWLSTVENHIESLEKKQYEPIDIPFIVPTPNCNAADKILNRLGRTRNFYFPDGEIDPILSKNKHQMITIHKMKGGDATCPVVLSPDASWERRGLKAQEQTKEKDCKEEEEEDDDFDPSNLVYLVYVSITRAKKEMMMVYTGASIFGKGEHDIQQKNIRMFGVVELCAGPTYEPLALVNICTRENVCLNNDDTKYFYDQRSRMFSGRTTEYGPTQENYAPVIGYAIEFAIANGLDQFLPNLKRIYDSLVMNFGISNEHRNRFQELKIFLYEAQNREDLLWEHFLKTGVYKFCTHGPKYRQLFRQLVGTDYIDTKHLDACRDRGIQIIQSLAESNEIVYQQKLQLDTPLGVIKGEADFLVGPTQIVVECKVTHEITEEHLMQPLLYSALLQTNFGQPCYVIAPNLNQCVRITPLPGITAAYLLEHAIRRKTGC